MKKFETDIAALSVESLTDDALRIIKGSIEENFPTSENAQKALLKTATSRLCTYVENEDYYLTLGLARFIFIAGFEEPMMELRKQGVFRVSKVCFKFEFISCILQKIPEFRNLSKNDLEYIRNVNTLLILAPSIRETRKQILNTADMSPYFLKTLLAVAEIKYSDLLWKSADTFSTNPYDLMFYENKESILSSASYIVQMLRKEKKGIGIKYKNSLDLENFDLYSNLIDANFSLLTYLKSEIDIDFYDYDATTNEENTVVLVSNEEFEIAKDHGYTKTTLRMNAQIKRHHSRSNPRQSYLKFLDELWRRAEQDDTNYLYSIKSDPIRITIPSVAFEYGHEMNIFGDERIFSEEELQLISLMDESYNSEAPSIKICGEFTCFDIFKIQRFFIYIGFIYRKASLSSKNIDKKDVEKVRLCSVLPVMGEQELIDIFSRTTGKDSVQCKKLLEKLAVGTFDPKETIDFQYNPIIKVETRYIILPTVFGHSNIIRSLAKSEGIHYSVIGKLDHMVKNVCEAMVSKGFIVTSDFKFGVDEIDVIAIKGEHLFLLECKNPYYPVNEFELRNTYAHIVKGFSQLENIKQRFSDRTVFEQFLKNLSIPMRSIKHVRYGVINANRALSGFAMNDIRVFHANEFINLISTGTISSGNYKFRVWHDSKFDVNDLVEYMDGNILYNDLIRHKIPIGYSLPITFSNQSLQFRSFEFDVIATTKYQRSRYKLLGRLS